MRSLGTCFFDIEAIISQCCEVSSSEQGHTLMWCLSVVLCLGSLSAVWSPQLGYILNYVPHRQLYLSNTFDGNLHAAMACVLSAVAAAFSGVPEEFCGHPHQTFESLSLVSALVRMFCGPAVFPFDLFPIFAQQHWYFYFWFQYPWSVWKVQNNKSSLTFPGFGYLNCVHFPFKLFWAGHCSLIRN